MGTCAGPIYTDGDVNAIAYAGGQVIAGGHWIYMNSGATYQPRLAAFDPATGVVDPTWIPKPNRQVWAFATDGTTLAVGGSSRASAREPTGASPCTAWSDGRVRRSHYRRLVPLG